MVDASRVVVEYQMFGFSSAKTRILNDGIHVKQEREDNPKFKRVYRVALPEGRTMQITARYVFSASRRDYSGEVDQPGGRWILSGVREADALNDAARRVRALMGKNRR